MLEIIQSMGLPHIYVYFDTKRLRCQSAKSVILFVSVLALLAGCQTRNTVEYDSLLYWRAKSRIASEVSAQELSDGAMDPAIQRPVRRMYVAQLFATYVKPGFTSGQMRAALPDTRWLDSCRVYLAGVLGGALPVHVEDKHEAPFCLIIFPDEEKWSPWVICFVLRVPRTDLDDEHGRAFIEGKILDDAFRLVEFAITYPVPYDDERTSAVSIWERFTERGVGLQILNTGSKPVDR